MKDKKLLMVITLFLSVLTSVLFFTKCSLNYNLINTFGKDISGFYNDYGTIYFYSDNDSIHFFQIIDDTIIDGVNYRYINFDYLSEFYSYTNDYIYKRYKIEDNYFNLPFLPRVIVNNAIYSLNNEINSMKYEYTATVDSIKDTIVLQQHTILYFVNTMLKTVYNNNESTIKNQFILSYDVGIVGFYYNNNWFIIDSIIK